MSHFGTLYPCPGFSWRMRDVRGPLRRPHEPVQRKSPPEIHFHIRWASGALDWERHGTVTEAEISAVRLGHPNEGHTIEECRKANNMCAEK